MARVDFKSREALIDSPRSIRIPIAKDKRGEAPFSVDRQLPVILLRRAGQLEDPWIEPPEYVHMRTISPKDAPDVATEITATF